MKKIKYKYMNKLVSQIFMISFFIVLILIIYEFYFKKENQNQNITKINSDTNQIIEMKEPKCHKGCPKVLDQNIIQTLYNDYEKIRGKDKHVNLNLNEITAPAIGPRNIFIIRHAEALTDPIPINLDCNGIYRSIYIIDLIEEINKTGNKIDVIVTTNPSYATSSMHSQQTISLASWLLNIPVYIFGGNTETKKTIEDMYKNTVFNNKNVLVCWAHSCIQTFLKDLLTIGPSIKNKPNKSFIDKNGKISPPAWPGKNYQTFIHIDDNFNNTIYSTGITTCYKKDSSTLIFGKDQPCISTIEKLSSK